MGWMGRENKRGFQHAHLNWRKTHSNRALAERSDFHSPESFGVCVSVTRPMSRSPFPLANPDQYDLYRFIMQYFPFFLIFDPHSFSQSISSPPPTWWQVPRAPPPPATLAGGGGGGGGGGRWGPQGRPFQQRDPPPRCFPHPKPLEPACCPRT